MPEAPRPTIPDLLLRQRGLVFLRSIGAPQSDQLVQGVELELAACGYLLSERLRARLTQCEAEELKAFHGWAPSLLAAHAGGGRKHVPLFRSFPDGVPSDTRALWWSKVLVHFLQEEGQPCLHCGLIGTTHVLDPCRHVVCDRCFDGTSYSACPVCEHAVDRTSPFFKPSAERGQPKERVTFKLLDLGDDLRTEIDAWFTALCQRKQVLSPTDREALTTIARER
jgi:Prokaryotic RING finger family 4